MDAKDYLYQVKGIKKRLESNMGRIHEIDMMLRCGSGMGYESPRVQSSPHNSFEEAEAEKDELVRECQRLHIELMNTTAEILSKAKHLSPRQYELVDYYYIKGFTIAEIASIWGFTVQAVYQMRKRVDFHYDQMLKTVDV